MSFGTEDYFSDEKKRPIGRQQNWSISLSSGA